jgi:hypothetical protein
MLRKLFRVPAVIADYTVGSVIVMVQLGLLTPRGSRAPTRRDRRAA